MFFFVVGNICEFHAFGHCYKFFDTLSTFEEAQSLCDEQQGHVVEVGSAEENEFVFEVLVGKKNNQISVS